MIDNQREHWPLGVQGNRQSSFAGSGITDISTTTVGPFAARSWPGGLVFVDGPDGGPDWSLRLSVTALFPS